MKKHNLPDVQNRPDKRGISLDRVGLTNLKFPTKILRKDGTVSEVSAKVKLFADLAENAKGHNLSRFSECLIEFGELHKVLSIETLPLLLARMQERLGSTNVYASFEFDYYIERIAPVSKIVAPMAYVCVFKGVKDGGKIRFILEVNVVAASLCPCSREMSLLENLTAGELSVPDGAGGNMYMKEEYFDSVVKDNKILTKKVGMGAHNQRSLIKVELLLNETVWIEDVIPVVEAQASAPTYPILKRPDEKFATELAYNNPKFSEDIARDVQLAITQELGVIEWTLRVENEESIHPHNVCCITRSNPCSFR